MDGSYRDRRKVITVGESLGVTLRKSWDFKVGDQVIIEVKKYDRDAGSQAKNGNEKAD